MGDNLRELLERAIENGLVGLTLWRQEAHKRYQANAQYGGRNEGWSIVAKEGGPDAAVAALKEVLTVKTREGEAEFERATLRFCEALKARVQVGQGELDI